MNGGMADSLVKVRISFLLWMSNLEIPKKESFYLPSTLPFLRTLEESRLHSCNPEVTNVGNSFQAVRRKTRIGKKSDFAIRPEGKGKVEAQDLRLKSQHLQLPFQLSSS